MISLIRPVITVSFQMFKDIGTEQETDHDPHGEAASSLSSPCFAQADARAGVGYGLATFQTPLTPSPVLSPGLVSLVHRYSGLPLYAHCLAPSSRVTIE